MVDLQIDELRKAMAAQNGIDERSALYSPPNIDESKNNDIQF